MTPEDLPKDMGLDTPSSLEQLVEAFSTYCSAHQGQSTIVEAFLDMHAPALRSMNDRQRVELLARLAQNEIQFRLSQGVDVSVTEYERRFPELDATILGDLIASPYLPPSLNAEIQQSSSLGLPSRYREQEVIGEGGIGRIYRVLDQVLERQVAVKVLRDELAYDVRAWNRLQREAKFTGRLQHPGIPPTYDVGRLQNGAPFFSMKVVEGETLSALLRKSKQLKGARRQFLKIVESLANTIAYAHEQGIIHRDIKPQNVMVGEFGEVQVMDWGLAKSLNESESEDTLEGPEQNTNNSNAVATPLPDFGQSFTADGDVMGTPCYMPPEQAQGKVRELDERSDVYSLGAVLYEVLTGSRLFAEVPQSDLLSAAAMAQLKDSLQLLENTDCDSELKDLTRRCLEPSVDARPQNASEVSNGIASYFEKVEQRLKEAELERSKASVQAREERKRRKIAIGLIGVLFAGIIGTTIGLLRANSEWQRAETNASRAREQEKLAEQKSKEAQEVVRDFYTTVSEEKLFDTPSLQPLRQEFLDAALEFYERASEESPNDSGLIASLGELHFRSAAATFSRGDISAAAERNDRAIEILSGELDRIESGDDEPNTVEISRSLRTNLARALMLRATAYPRIGKAGESEEWFEKSEQVFATLVNDYPDDTQLQRFLGELYSSWGNFLSTSPTPERALGYLEDAYEIRERIARESSATPYDRYDLARIIWDIGYNTRLVSANESTERWREMMSQALDYYNQALEILIPLVEENPGSLAFESTLAEVYNTIAVVHNYKNNRGSPSREERDANNELGLEAYRKALEIHERLVLQNPGNDRFEFNLSRAYMGIGIQLKLLDRIQEGIEAYEASLAIRRSMLERHPNDIAIKTGLANLLGNTGLAYSSLEDGEEKALEYMHDALTIQREVVAAAPNVPRYRTVMCMQMLSIGLALRKSGKFEEASEIFTEAISESQANPTDLFTAARFQAALFKDAEEASSEQAQRYAQETLQTLNMLVELKAIGLDDLQQEDFNALRGSEAFQDVVSRIAN